MGQIQNACESSSLLWLVSEQTAAEQAVCQGRLCSTLQTVM